MSKALRFGLTEVQPGQPFSNADRVREEVEDLLGVYLILDAESQLPAIDFSGPSLRNIRDRKLAKIEKFMAISRAQGTLS